MSVKIKELVKIVLSTALLGLCFALFFTYIIPIKYKPQDVNKDGVVDIMDMMEIKKYMIDNGIEFQNCGLE